MCRFDAWFADIYSTKALGANVSEDRSRTDFRLFAPRAEMVRLHLYTDKNDAKAYQSVDMAMDAQGVWEFSAEEDLFKVWYDFSVHGPADEPGSHYFEQTQAHVSDPYARVNDDAFGKSRVWYKGVPASPVKGGIPPYEDVIAYEVHVQDFTDLLPVEDSYKGTMLAMIEPGLTNSNGAPIGFDHLVDLGINTVHLMPIQEYLHYTDEEWQAAFKDDPFMIEQDIHLENYQWGYRITHAMAVENRFRTKGSEHGAEREQFKQLIEAFHEKGMAVIVDYVFNHTGENMDGRHYNMNFNGIDKHYYYRLDGEGNHIGAFGNETKSENRPMMQRWIIDQCVHYIEEFGVDGFRIDLAGQTDEQTLIKLRDVIGHDKIVYGEPWIGSNDPDYEANPDWDWYKIDSPITFFQDDARNAFKGPPSNPTDKTKDRGFAGGSLKDRPHAIKALTNNYEEEPTPNAGINYLDIHDNWALADRFALTNWDGRQGVHEDRFKIATTLLFTSAGPIVLHGGTEFMRSKALAELKAQIKETASGQLYFHGKNDTYNLRAANRFVWENVGTTPENGPDYANMHQWWKGAIAFRNSSFGQSVRVGEKLPENHYVFFAPEDQPAILGYVIDQNIAVAINVGEQAATLEWSLPEGQWQQIANTESFQLDGLNTPLMNGGSQKVRLEATDLSIWIKKSSN
jgi:pullulanase/glycogen debranching enzyme